MTFERDYFDIKVYIYDVLSAITASHIALYESMNYTCDEKHTMTLAVVLCPRFAQQFYI